MQRHISCFNGIYGLKVVLIMCIRCKSEWNQKTRTLRETVLQHHRSNQSQIHLPLKKYHINHVNISRCITVITSVEDKKGRINSQNRKQVIHIQHLNTRRVYSEDLIVKVVISTLCWLREIYKSYNLYNATDKLHLSNLLQFNSKAFLKSRVERKIKINDIMDMKIKF